MAESVKNHQDTPGRAEESLSGSPSYKMPSKVPDILSKISTASNTPIAPILEPMVQFPSLEYIFLDQNASDIAYPNSLTHEDFVSDKHHAYLTLPMPPLPGLESACDVTAMSLDNDHLGSFPSQGLLIRQQAVYPLIQGSIDQTPSPQGILGSTPSNEGSVMNHSLAWSIQTNEYPSSTESYANTTHSFSSYPNTNHPQLAAYVHASSSADLPVSEWLIKNDWEDKRLERL